MNVKHIKLFLHVGTDIEVCSDFFYIKSQCGLCRVEDDDERLLCCAEVVVVHSKISHKHLQTRFRVFWWVLPAFQRFQLLHISYTWHDLIHNEMH